MDLTVEQAMQQGVTAHNAGKLEEAERLYRAILQSQPAHPDASHNLGVIAVSVNQAKAALPLFKTALEANPKIEQFWLSYIDALIKEKQFDNARQILEQAKKQGVSRDKVDAIEAQITTATQVNEPKLVVQEKSLTLSEKRKKLAEQKKQKKAKKQNLKAISPSKSEIKSLLEHYQNGWYDDAEKLAKSITQEFPEYQFAWKVLGAVLTQTGRVSESLIAKERAVQLAPHDAEAQSNLGVTLQEMGRLDEAEASLRQAISLKSDYADAHSNLGNTLKELGRLDGAEASYTQAIALKPDFAEAYTNLGAVLQEMGRLDGAEASYTQAIALKPDFALAHCNLGAMLQELGRLDEAAASLRQAIVLKPDFALAHSYLARVLYKLGYKDSALESIENAHRIDPEVIEYKLILSVIKTRKSREEMGVAISDTSDTDGLKELALSPLIFNRVVESGLIACLYGMSFREINQIKRGSLLASGRNDARYGNGKCSPDFNLFQDSQSIIQKLAEDLTRIMMKSVKSDVFIYESFFNILGAGGGLIPHTHISDLDKEIGFNLGKQKYSLVYYLSVGDQDCSEPGVLKLYEPDEDILPNEGMIMIFPARRMHSVVYGGKTDRVMIGVNFYSL